MVTGADRRAFSRLRRWTAVALLALAVGGLAGADPATGSRLAIRGTAEFEKLGPIGQQVFELRLQISNPGESAVGVRAARAWLCHEGGWLVPLERDSKERRLFEGSLEMAAGGTHDVDAREFASFTPATHVVLALDATDGHAHVSIPILRKGHEAPAACRPLHPFGVGFVGPLEVVPFSDGSSGLLLIGQHQVPAGGKPTEVRTTISVSSDKGSVDPVSWKGLGGEGDRRALWPFARRITVFEDFDQGRLRLSARAKVGGEAVTIEGVWDVVRTEPVALRAPVLGRWQLSNGPGQTHVTDHYANPQLRYAYDMLVLKQGRTHDGDPHDNEAYFAWNRSIRAAADGKIVAACSLERDNPGHRGSLSTCYDNHIVIEHEGGLFTEYLHLRQGSIAKDLKAGAAVKAGQVIARVGNSGDSSEPHLHFMAFRLDASGRRRSVPVSFSNASHDAKGVQPVRGVALGGATYHFRSP